MALVPQSAMALTPLPTPPPIPGSYGLEAVKNQAPPTTGATITTPGDGASFNNTLVTVTGICPTDLLVQVYDNGVMVGAVMCENGSFSLQISLFAGSNILTASVFDNLDQIGPESNKVTVNYTDTHFTSFAQQVTLTSSYGRRSAPAKQNLAWPLQIAGGTGPYALSIDWGDGSKAGLQSQALPGVFDISHSYAKAGIYRVSVTATDTNGVTAFLQLVAISSGKVDASTAVTTEDQKVVTSTKIMWTPYIISLALSLPVFWLGRRSQLVTIRNKLLKERDNYQEEPKDKS